MKGIIYCYTNLINDKKYIGQTYSEKTRRYSFNCKTTYTTSRKAGGKLSHFDAALKKYGKENFSYNVIQEIEYPTLEELTSQLDILKKYYIEYFDSFNNGYNSTTGGKDGLLSEETKKKIGESLVGRPMSELTREKLTFNGHHWSDEDKKRMSDSAKERFRNKTNHPMYGKHHSEESKRKNSLSRKGKCTGKENKQSKAVIQYTLEHEYVNTFDCIAEALRFLGKNIKQPGSIIKCCKGIYKSAFGYIWKYV